MAAAAAAEPPLQSESLSVRCQDDDDVITDADPAPPPPQEEQEQEGEEQEQEEEDKLKYIDPTEPPPAGGSRYQGLLELPIIKEMESLRVELRLPPADPAELDAILAGTLLDHGALGLTAAEVHVVQRKIRELRVMPMDDMLEYVKLCTFA